MVRAPPRRTVRLTVADPGDADGSLDPFTERTLAEFAEAVARFRAG